MKPNNSLCISGGKTTEDGKLINEDKVIQFAFKDENEKEIKYTTIMDGATGLGKNNQIVPGKTSAEWYVDFMADKFYEYFKENPKASIQEVTEKCIQSAIEVINEFEKEKGIELAEYEKPSAGLTIMRDDGENVEIFALGDTDTIIEHTDGTVEHFDNPNQKALQILDGRSLEIVAGLKEQGVPVYDALRNPKTVEMLRFNREKKNRDCEGQYWVLGTTPGSTEKGAYKKYPRKDISRVLLATDGFNREIIGKDEKGILELIDKIGLKATMQMIWDAEENDPNLDCRRFKLHDDKTVIAVGVQRVQAIGVPHKEEQENHQNEKNEDYDEER